MNEEIKLSWKGKLTSIGLDLFVGKVIHKANTLEGEISLVLEGKDLLSDKLLKLKLYSGDSNDDYNLCKVKDLQDVNKGDIISVKGTKVRAVYRVKSNNNFIFATIRCNSNCLMCSQPPLDVNDINENYLIWNYTIELIENNPEHITITGGEPTLLEGKLVLIINKILSKFPNLLITVLSNGRLLALDDNIEILDKVHNKKNVIFGIPLYSDVYKIHDHIVQAKDAFHQTNLGIHKISSIGFPVEIRIVLHKLSNPRLLNLSKFIHRNFPFTYHITFMGLELIGYTKANKKELVENNEQVAMTILNNSLTYLESWNYNISIYNTPLCHLPQPLWKFAKKSISDWKNSFKLECDKCIMKENCSGFFSWNLKDANVKPFLD